MFHTILVPLDGSVFGEKALPYAVNVARKANAELRLVHVVPPRHAPAAKAGARNYLRATAERLAAAGGVRVGTELLEGPIDERLCAYAATTACDLIVLTSHGRGALARFWLGSVTDKLVRSAPCPVLTVRPAPDLPDHPGDGARRVLVPLDGTPFSEEILPTALRLADLFVAEVLLVRVVEPVPLAGLDATGFSPVVVDMGLVEQLEADAGAYLDRVAGRLRDAGWHVQTRVLIHELPARAILDEARPDDLIALQTHARSGAARLLLGSVTDKVLRGAAGPVLTRHPAPNP
jgi:nucleotide-binding universal stress UspA family protein